MRYWSNKELRRWLREGGFAWRIIIPFFVLDQRQLEAEEKIVLRQHPNDGQSRPRAAYRLISKRRLTPDEQWKVWLVIWAVLELVLLTVIVCLNVTK